MAAVVLRVRWWLRASRSSAAALSVVVAVVGGIALTVFAGAIRTATVVDRYVASQPLEHDAEIEQESGSPRADELADLPEVDHLAMATFLFAAITPVGELAPVEAYTFAGDLEPLASGLSSGHRPTDGAPGEFVATPALVDQLGAELGDRFQLVTLTQDQSEAFGFDLAAAGSLDGPVVPATLVGVIAPGVADAEDDLPLALFGSALLDTGDIGVAASVGVVDVAPGVTLDELRARLDQLDDGASFSIAPAELVSREVRTAAEAQALGVIVLAAIVVAAGVVVLVQQLTRQLRLDGVEQDVLEAIGYTSSQSASEPIGRALVVLVAGVVGATVVAVSASGLFPSGFSRRIEPHPGLRFDPIAHLGGAAALLALVLLVSAPFLRVRPASPHLRAAPLVDRATRALRSIRTSTALRFAFGPGPRAGSTAASLGGVVLLLSLVVGALTVGTNLARLLDEPARYGDNYDLGIGQGGDSFPAELVDGLAEAPEVAGVTLYGAATAAIGSRSIGFVGFEPVRGDLLPQVLEGRLPAADDEVALGRPLASSLGLDVGDELEVTGASGAQRYHVTGIAIVGTFEESDVAGRNALVTGDGLQRIDREESLSSMVLDLAADAPADAPERLAERFEVEIGTSRNVGGDARARGRFDPPSNILTLSQVRTVPFVVAGLVGLLAVLTIGQLLLVGVRRRRPELAVLRAIGAPSRWVGSVIHGQATMIVGLAAILAIPTGVVAGSAVYRRYAEGVGASADVVVPLGVLLAGLLVLLLLAHLVVAVPLRRLRRTVVATLLSVP